jgi:hypothetical protein
MEEQDAERLAEVLGQCRELVHLNLSGNFNFGAAGVERIPGVLGQCPELVYLNLSVQSDRVAGAESLAGVLGQCASLTHLNLLTNVTFVLFWEVYHAVSTVPYPV